MEAVTEPRSLVHTYLQAKFGIVDASRFDEVLAQDYVEHQPSVTRDAQACKEFASRLALGFPVQHFTIEDTLDAHRSVVVRYTWRATHSGRFMEWAATGREIRTHGIIIANIAGGKIRELWEEWDFAGFLRQIGSGSSTA